MTQRFCDKHGIVDCQETERVSQRCAFGAYGTLIDLDAVLRTVHPCPICDQDTMSLETARAWGDLP